MTPPRHWEADVLLRDGRTAHIRPIRAEDAGPDGRVLRPGLATQSKYYRFFAPMPELSERDVDRFTHVDHVDRVALRADRRGADDRRRAATTLVKPGEAEVAFLVEDAHQGRGIGQLLLEHLAQAGRERGVERFVAEVLPDNQADDPDLPRRRLPRGQRLRGRRDAAGVPDRPDRHRHRGDGGPRAPGRVGLDRDVLQPALGRGDRRQPPPGHDRPGAGAQPGHRRLHRPRVRRQLPRRTAVSGLPAYASVGEIPDEVDVAIVAVPAEAVQDVVLDCAAKGVHGLIVISSGFAETGEEGRQRQRRLVGLSRSYGLRLIGPNCLGVINTDPDVSLNASLSPLMPPRGRAGFFCQSGALGSAILEKVNNRGLGPLDVRQRRQPRRRLRQRPAAVLGGGRRHRGRAALPRVDRQPAQVLPDRAPGLAAQADHRRPLGAHHPGRADGPRRAPDRGAARPPSTRCSARPA